jgi:hypothetical protein
MELIPRKKFLIRRLVVSRKKIGTGFSEKSELVSAKK